MKSKDINNKTHDGDAEYFLQLTKKIARGDYGLAMTYWVFWVLIGNILSFVFTYILGSLNDKNMLDYILSNLLIVIVLIFYFTVVGMGVWKSANKYKKKKIWATFAKATITLNIVFVVLSIYAVAMQY